MRHAAIGGGKRLRPLLVQAASDLFNISRESALRVGLAVECIHVYSLIHDDLPAMDDDDLRRGKPTVHKAFDEASAILAGDCLHDLAFEVLADEDTHPDPFVRIELVRALALASGPAGMAGGQMMDLEAEKARFDLATVTRLQNLKTGALIAFCVDAAAIMARLPQEARDAAPAAARVARLRAEIRAAHAPLQALHQAILDRIAAALPADAFVSTDMTQLAYTGNYAFASRAPRSWLHPTGYGTLGYGLPAGIGAKLGAPQRPGLVLVGDGGFLYTAQELATASEELDSPLVVLLWNNDALGQIRDDMLGLDIEPVGVLPRNPDFALLGRAYGCAVRQPQDLDELERDLRAGFGQPGVTLIELRHACAR